MNCLLAYLSRAANPIRRCSRILDRLCGNPLIFEKLILLQVPALLVKYLVLEEDGTFPTVMFCTEWENQFGILQRSRMNVSDLFPSSQSSDNTGSPASELGRLMDLEFGGDAYSRMVSSKAISVRSFYRGRPSLSVESQAARDGSSSDDVYEAGCNRSQVRVQLGLKLLHSLGSVAMSNFGRGEIQHALTHRTPPDRLASLISLLYIPFGWYVLEHAPTRRSFIRQYNLWDQLLPCLFIPEAPRAREAIVAGVSLNLHLESPAKCVRLVPKLFLNHEAAGQNPLSEVVTLTSHGQSTSDNTRGSTTEPGGETLGSEKEEKPGDGKGGCPYARKSHDVTFVIHEDGTTHRYKVNKQDMVQKSSIFAAMLAGSYIESTKSEIVISEVNPAVFEFIVHYLHGCSIGCRVIDSITPKCAASADHRENKKQQPNAILEFQILDDNGCQQVTSDIPVLDSNKGSRSGLHRQCVASPAPNEEVPGDATPEVKLDRNSLHSMNDLTQSQESLDSLTLEDRNDGTETSQSYPGIFTSENHLENNETETMSPSERGADKLLQLVNKCADILVVADQFLLSDLLSYVCSILSHVCLQPNTSETIFPLACFYKLDALAVDCMRETLLSNLSSQEAAAIYVDLGASGYKDQAIMALSNLLNKAFKD
ncbi:unnamed protein product [Lymnaea stagnalis]|uniref:BTB domain-containing protein n=1 Tax=Lymnaea stagnalis TaxID=6523 RepID=A0AAV2H6K1_LYMST